MRIYMISMQWHLHFAHVLFEQEKMGRTFDFNQKYGCIIFHTIF